MAFVLADRVKDTTTTTGTGTVTLSGTAPAGYQTFGTAIGDGNTTYYAIIGTSEWEVGIGTYTSAGTTLSRTTVLSSSNSGSLVNFSAGSKDVIVTYPASKSANLDTSGNAVLGGTISSSATSVAAFLINNAAEPITVSATAATGTINYDILTQSLIYYTSNAGANWTVNLRGSGAVTMNTLLSTGQAITVGFFVTQGATPYYNNVVQVDGTTSGVTTKWQGGAPTSGNPSSIDAYSYTIIKTGNATFTVLASQTKFA